MPDSPRFSAEVVSVGTELLLGQIVDTHAATAARVLAQAGIGCQRRSTVGDNFERIVGVLKEALSRADVVIAIGGLGPTQDDLTRDAIAAALGDELVIDPAMETKLRDIFERRKLPWQESILRQAQRPESAELIENPNGTAPGLHCRKNGKTVIALPGPKMEFEPMMQGPALAILERLSGSQVIHSHILRICGLGESTVEQMLLDLMEGTNPTVAPYAQPAEVHLRVTASAASKEAAEAIIEPVAAEIKSRLGSAVYGINSTTLEEAMITEMSERGLTVATAESMTAGLVAARLTSVPGSSKVFGGGVLPYSVAAKEALLGLDRAKLAEEGPVSPWAAIQLAKSVRQKLGTSFGVGVVGNAGPTVDVDNKPVGYVCIAIDSESGTEAEELQYRGSREQIRFRACQQALVMLREEVLKVKVNKA
ncbi:MAG: competence/damage-inducible protein A [Armatimonadetes bacterium]|nr:competence/damage-inducible protein A [Armatimonadota bacterium]